MPNRQHSHQAADRSLRRCVHPPSTHLLRCGRAPTTCRRMPYYAHIPWVVITPPHMPVLALVPLHQSLKSARAQRRLPACAFLATRLYTPSPRPVWHSPCTVFACPIECWQHAWVYAWHPLGTPLSAPFRVLTECQFVRLLRIMACWQGTSCLAAATLATTACNLWSSRRCAVNQPALTWESCKLCHDRRGLGPQVSPHPHYVKSFTTCNIILHLLYRRRT